MTSFDKLKNKLAELFQLDQADLDFGIYRIMNAKREEITRFLEHDLLPQVRKEFAKYKSEDKAEVQKELEKAVQQSEELGADPDTVPKVRQLQKKLQESVDTTALENDVYDHLFNFFSRYYHEGDYISLRRYKDGVYAIPYEGEEVKLYWANYDQYYIKTSEYFRDYAFLTDDGRRVHFKIAEADTEKDNVKASNGKDRRFFLHEEKPVCEEDGELVIRFEYRPDPEKRKQAVINAQIVERVLDELAHHKELMFWFPRLTTEAPTDNNPNRTLFEKHVTDYTKRNTFDYFIHKDLGSFLRRELDFYIKNEVMHLDDVENESAPRVEQYLSKIKVIRRIAHKIIDFLAQIENFQKKLWLKKKFVIETNYCVTLDRIPEEFYPEIAENDAQRQEWVKLFAIDEIGKRKTEEKESALLSLISNGQEISYTEPLTVDFLRTNPCLVLDTRHFSDEFKWRLIAAIDEIDEQCDGILIHSENFQALSLMMERYRREVKCVYIDPPYNTGDDGFLYRDTYMHSSWLTMLVDRVLPTFSLLSSDGCFFSSIDDNEFENYGVLLRQLFGKERFFGTLVWEKKKKGAFLNNFITNVKEYILACAKDITQFQGLIGEVVTKEETYPCVNASNPREIRIIPPGIISRFRQKDVVRPKGTTISAGNMNMVLNSDMVIKGGRLAKELIIEGNWRYSQEKMHDLAVSGELYITQDLYLRRFVRETRYKRMKDLLPRVGSSGGQDFRAINVNNLFEHGWGSNEDANQELLDVFGKQYLLSYPKPSKLITLLLASVRKNSGFFLDYFAGSGTTAHAVINLNREDGGNRKYILVEMADYFDTVLMPRIKKVVYSKDWKNGKPVSRDTGISHMFKYIRLESYEDTLGNLELRRDKAQQLTLDQFTTFRESYMLRYMLETETQASPSLLNIDWFDDPFNYKLLVGTGSVGETKAVNVDLVETFNWLLGLRVRHMDFFQERGIEKNDSGETKKLKFVVVEGMNPKGEKVLVIWRKIRDLSETDPDKIKAQREQANRELEDFFKKQQYNTLDSEFDVIYVNGDNTLMNIPISPEKRELEPRYKVRLIEEEFKRLMFDVEDV